MTKPKTQVLAVNLGVGDGAIDVAQIIADFVQRPVVMVTSDGKEVTIAPRALDLGALARHVKARSALT